MSSERRSVGSGTPWENRVGYSRAVRVGAHIHVSGTTATNEKQEIVGEGDPYRQTVRIIEKIRAALRGLGADLQDVVRTRLYVTDIEHRQAVGKAHQEFFGEIRPATTMVEVSRLIAPSILVEIEADAIAPDGS